MTKWFVYFVDRHGVKRCHCFEDDEQQAGHFSSLVDGEVILEINGSVILKQSAEMPTNLKG